MKQDLDKNLKTDLTLRIELFSNIKNLTDERFRDFVKGFTPIDADISYSEVRANKYSLVIHNMDYEYLRAKLRKRFAENLIFDYKQIENLKVKYELTNSEARAVYFSEFIYLCANYEEKAIEYFVSLIEEFLEKFINEVQLQLLDKCLKKFLNDFSEGQDRNKASVDILDNIDSSLKNSRALVKNPNVGRPLESISKKGITEVEISQAITELLSDKLPTINKIFDVEDKLKVTKKEFCVKIGLSRPTINKRFEKLGLDYDELVERLTKQFIRDNSATNAVLNEYISMKN